MKKAKRINGSECREKRTIRLELRIAPAHQWLLECIVARRKKANAKQDKQLSTNHSDIILQGLVLLANREVQYEAFMKNTWPEKYTWNGWRESENPPAPPELFD